MGVCNTQEEKKVKIETNKSRGNEHQRTVKNVGHTSGSQHKSRSNTAAGFVPTTAAAAVVKYHVGNKAEGRQKKRNITRKGSSRIIINLFSSS